MSPLGVHVLEHDHSGPLKGGGDLRVQSLTTRSFRLATAPTANYALIADAAGVGTWQDISTGLGVDLAGYFKLAGRLGGTTGFGGTAVADALVLANNSADGHVRATFQGGSGSGVLISDPLNNSDGVPLVLDLSVRNTTLAVSSGQISLFRGQLNTSGSGGTSFVLSSTGVFQCFADKTGRSVGGTTSFLNPKTAVNGAGYGHYHSGGVSKGPYFFLSATGSERLAVDISAITAERIWTIQNVAGIVATCDTVPAGSVIYGTTTGVGFLGLANGTSGQVLQSNGGTAAPSWVTVAGGSTDFGDDVFRVHDNADGTKKLALEVSAIGTGTTKTWTAQNVDGTVATCNSVPAGSVIYGASSGVGFLALTNGTNGQVLTSAGGTSAPTWTTPSGGSSDPLSLTERATPSPPATDTGILFTRANGANIQLVFLSSAGQECVICDLLDFNHVNTMLFNGIE